jgi:hypothetical protein
MSSTKQWQGSLLVATNKTTKSTKLKKEITVVESSGVERLRHYVGFEHEQRSRRGKKKLWWGWDLAEGEPISWVAGWAIPRQMLPME